MRSAECGEWGAEKKIIKKCACDDNRITNDRRARKKLRSKT